MKNLVTKNFVGALLISTSLSTLALSSNIYNNDDTQEIETQGRFSDVKLAGSRFIQQTSEAFQAAKDITFSDRSLENASKKLLTQLIFHYADVKAGRETAFYGGITDERSFDKIFKKFLNGLQDQVENQIMLYMTKTNLYTFNKDGSKNTVYQNAKLTNLFLDKFLPSSTPCRSLIVGLTKIDPLDKLFRKSVKFLVAQQATKIFKNYFRDDENATVYENLANNAISKFIYPVRYAREAAIDWWNQPSDFDFQEFIQSSKDSIISVKNDIMDFDYNNAIKLVSKTAVNLDAESYVDTYVKDQIHNVSSLMPQDNETFSELWKVFKPHADHCLRMTFTEGVKVAQDFSLNKFKENFKQPAVRTGQSVGTTIGTIGTYAFSSITLTVLSSLTGLDFTGYSYLLSGLGGTAGYHIGGGISSHYYDIKEEKLSKSLTKYSDDLAHQLFPLTYEEHARYNLNPNPTDIERGLFFSDYKKHDELMQKYFVADIIRALSKDAGIHKSIISATDYISSRLETLFDYFSTHPDATAEAADKAGVLERYINTDDDTEAEAVHKAHRQFWALDEYEREDVTNNLLQYPAFEDPKLDSDDEEIAKDLISIAERIHVQTSICFNDIKKAFFTSLTISEQNKLYENQDHVVSKLGDKVDTDNFIDKLTKIILKLDDSEIANYFKNNKEEIYSLQRLSLSDGIKRDDLVKLHKKLVEKGHLDEFLGQSVEAEKPDAIEKLSRIAHNYYKEMKAKQRGVSAARAMISSLYKQDILDKAIENAQNKTTNEACSFNDVANSINEIEEYKEHESITLEFLKKLAPWLTEEDDFESLGALTKIAFGQEEKRILSDYIKNKIVPNWDLANINKHKDISDVKESGFWSYWGRKSNIENLSSIQFNEENLQLKVEDLELNTKVYKLTMSGSTEDINGQISLADIIKSRGLCGEYLCQDFFNELAQEIFDKKISKLSLEEERYYKRYESEFLNILMIDEYYGSRLFFSLKTAIEKKKQENTKLLHEIFS
jgi:hypothetical protein